MHVLAVGRYQQSTFRHWEVCVKTALDPSQVRPTLAKYYTPVGGPAPDEKLIIMYINWAEVGLETTDFFLNKTRYAVSILQTYKNFRSSVDAITPAINQMMVGTRSKQACQELGRKALETQELCRLAIESYFLQNVQVADETTIATFLSSFLDK